MSWQQVALAGVAPQAWKNGGGTTRELLAWPAATDWRVRLSVAEVARSGPFSRYDGVRRWFAVLDGAGVRLQVGGVFHTLTPGDGPLAFDGAEPVDCELLAGATQDFNLMSREGSPVLRHVRGTWEGRVDASVFVAVYAHSSGATVTLGRETLRVPPATLAWQVLPAAGVVGVSSTDALWMEVVP
ncbi:MAG: HutD family protein [Ramlibacter sp.]|nr:HutD family protein [Ramlibacter sp.]